MVDENQFYIQNKNIYQINLNKLREWIKNHPKIRYCRTDDVFLSRFLRKTRNNLEPTKVIIEKYVALRKHHPKWFTNLDILNPKLEEIFDSGYIFPLPERDYEGRIVIMCISGNFDYKKFNSDLMVQMLSIIFESVMDMEETQLKGINYINDQSGLAMGHLSMWSLEDIRNVLKCPQGVSPIKYKIFNFINVSSYGKKLMDIVMSFMSEKLRKRILWHESTSTLKDQMDISILPKEYGGVTPMADIIADYKKKLIEMRGWMLDLDQLDIIIEDRKSSASSIETDDVLSGVSGSFKKLEVD